MDNFNLYLIRHGETNDSVEKRYCGNSSVSLTKKGQKQAGNIYRKVRVPIDTIWTSSQPRAIETAKLAFPDCKPIKTRAINELDFGTWEGLTYKEITDTAKNNYNDWVNGFWNIAPPQGETLKKLNERVVSFLNNLCFQLTTKATIVVAHAGSIKAMVCHLLEKSLKEEFWNVNIGLGSINKFRIINGKVEDYVLNVK